MTAGLPLSSSVRTAPGTCRAAPPSGASSRPSARGCPASRCSRPTSTCTVRRWATSWPPFRARRGGHCSRRRAAPPRGRLPRHVDIAAAVSRRPDVLVTRALGPDDRLVDLLVDRLVRVGAERGGAVVLAPAGSSDPRATADSAETAARLARRWGGPVTVGYAAGPVPTVADAVAAARAGTDGAPVAVALYLLAPGSFQRRVETAGGDVVTGPLAPDPRASRSSWPATATPSGRRPSPSPGRAGLRPRRRR